MKYILNARDSSLTSGGASFSLENRLQRLAWTVTWGALAAWTPPPFRKWRNLLLRLFGARLAPTAIIYGSARIWLPSNLRMDDFACIGPGVNVYCMAPISLGKRAIVSQGSYLCAGSHDIEDPHFQLFAKPIWIGDDAWVAAEAFVGPGVTVHEGAVLGARGVAMKNLDAWSVYAGNPARFLKIRKLGGNRTAKQATHVPS